MVQYRPPKPGIQRWLLWLYGVVTLILLVVGIVAFALGRRVDVGALVVGVGSLALLLALRLVPRTVFVADSTAIRRPRPLHDVSWSDVDHVQATTRWSDTVRVVMTDGSVKPTGFPPEYAERLAAIGNKPLK